VIALSAHAAGQYVSEMLQAGAVGYVLKSQTPEHLVEGIRAVSRGEAYLCPKVAGVVVDGFLGGSGRGSRLTHSELSDRESEVVQLLTEGKSTREIAAALHVSTRTVEGHRQRVMKKLGLSSVAELVKYAIREGLTTPDP